MSLKDYGETLGITIESIRYIYDIFNAGCGVNQ